MEGKEPEVRENIALGPLTTLGLGGAGRWFCEPARIDEAAAFLRWVQGRGLPLLVLGGGSNIVIPDEGFEGAVLKVGFRGLELSQEGGAPSIRASAGEPWDGVAAAAVGRGWGGLESLSGIPGTVGAVPMQNVGAYGAEVSSAIERVLALDLETLEERTFSAKDCGFGYRTSRFKTADAGRFLITSVAFRLDGGGLPRLTHDEVRRRFEARVETGIAASGQGSLALIRDIVLGLRREKSMVVDPADPHSASAGSFFLNPVLDAGAFAAVQSRWKDGGDGSPVPAYPEGGRFKVPAAWLIERSGFPKGSRRGHAGVSPKHALALVNYGGTTRELLSLAREIRSGVEARFGVRLVPEPVLVNASL